MEEQCAAMADYLLECLASDPTPDGFVHSGATAGHDLAAWLKHLGGMREAGEIVARVAARLEGLCRHGGPEVRERISTSALEHILESRPLRRLFAHWGEDPTLRGVYEPALRWGLAHPDGPAAPRE